MSKSRSWHVLGCLILMVALPVQSKSFGVHGALYDIIEEDGRVTLLKSAARVNWDAVTEDVVESAKNYSDSLPKLDLYPPHKVSVNHFIPKAKAKRDIKAPIVESKKVVWETLIAKDTEVNALDYIEPIKHRLYINAEDLSQIEYAKELIEGYGIPLDVILVKGDTRKVQELLSLQVFHASEKQVADLGVEFVPTLVSPTLHEGINKLRLTSLNRPFSLARLRKSLNE